MSQILRYVGPFEGITIPSLNVEVLHGEPFRVSDEDAERLLDQPENYEVARNAKRALELLNKGQLFELADVHEIEVAASATKPEIIKALVAGGITEAPESDEPVE